MSKTKYIFRFFLVGLLGIMFANFTQTRAISKFHKFYPSPNSSLKNIAGNTGAPGESTCAECHKISVTNGGNESKLIFKDSTGLLISDYRLNHTYDLTFSLNSSGRKGFQVIPLDLNNNQAGTLIAGIGTMILTSNNKKYLNHSNANNSTWTFKWKAPSKNVGDITFYVAAGNKIDVYKSTYKISVSKDTTTQTGNTDTTKTNGIKVNENNFEFTSFYVATSQNLYLKYAASISGDAFVNVLDLNGRSVFFKKLGPVNRNSIKDFELPLAVQPGTYVINMFVNNYISSKKIVVF